ncbi:3-phosphoserine/phosphohydroxythreonine transaminase [Peribacillus deserti]|uniref:Phosphoserine aminotransferase n=1 Tax=Peribacillus deserti TaxID=673318 RepID=A0A2N5MA38_9BACI|nr:3-phosphoserine/phosphohydroxythreonine transaminase [Peribacillus deserti]PLT31221.1 3-phosphoserine/phosphohydroxythreonine transaminase [Peribacillus deserti]
MERALNFNAGPAALPLEVLEKAKDEWLNYSGTGMSILEMSHRSPEFESVLNHAKKLLTELLDIPETHEVLFLQGGASLQFSMVPYNLLTEEKRAYYVLTGVWSEKALAEARKLGETITAATAKPKNYTTIPSLDDLQLRADAAYLHITSNNTIYGTQWPSFPDTGSIPLVADMSSDILSRPLDISKFGLIYAGAQKNLGPSGVTVVIIKKDLIREDASHLPAMLNYHTYYKNNSLFNTPPSFAIYLLSLVLEWTKKNGGIAGIEDINRQKAALLYKTIDESDGFYKGHAEKPFRSQMNVTFTLQSEELTRKFLAFAKEEGFKGLNGHRSIGGCRASIYNAIPLAHCEKLADFMLRFKKMN